MRDLKGSSNITEANNNPSFEEPKQQPEMASNNNGGQQQNTEIINMIGYIEQNTNIEQNTKTSKNFGEQLKIQLDTNLIQYGML